MLLLNIQRIFQQDTAGVIGIEMIAGKEGYATDNGRLVRPFCSVLMR